MDNSSANPASGPIKPREGWQEVRRRAETKFKSNFEPIRRQMGFNDLIGSVFELFFSALGAVTKISLGVQSLPDPEEEIRSSQLLSKKQDGSPLLSGSDKWEEPRPEDSSNDTAKKA